RGGGRAEQRRSERRARIRGECAQLAVGAAAPVARGEVVLEFPVGVSAPTDVVGEPGAPRGASGLIAAQVRGDVRPAQTGPRPVDQSGHLVRLDAEQARDHLGALALDLAVPQHDLPALGEACVRSCDDPRHGARLLRSVPTGRGRRATGPGELPEDSEEVRPERLGRAQAAAEVAPRSVGGGGDQLLLALRGEVGRPPAQGALVAGEQRGGSLVVPIAVARDEHRVRGTDRGTGGLRHALHLRASRAPTGEVRAAQSAGRTRPATSPSRSRDPGRAPDAVITMLTSSPSSRNVRSSEPTRIGRAPPWVSSSRQPRSSSPGPLIVPPANRSPVRSGSPPEVRWASICPGPQYVEAYGGRLTTWPLSRTSTSMAYPAGPFTARCGNGGGSCGGSSTRASSRAASGVTQAAAEVANALPSSGPSGAYSHPWMSRADQSLTATTPKTCSLRSSGRIRVPGAVGGPTTNPSSASKSSRRLG